MASPTYNTTYELNERTVFAWGRELVAAGTVTAAWTKEEFGTFSYTPTRNIFVNQFRTGFPSRRQGSQTTWQYADWTLQIPAHAGGLLGYALIAMLGDVTNVGTADTVTGGADPYTHTAVPGIKGTRCVSFSGAFIPLMDPGTVPAWEFLYSVIKSIRLMGGGGSVLMAEIQATSYWPVTVAAPSGSFSTPNTYTFGYQSNHSIFQSASASTKYTAQVLDADVTVSRALNIPPSYNNNGSTNPIDIIPLDLNLQAGMTLYYDGIATGTHYSEYLNYLKSGTSANPDKLIWTDANAPAHSIEIDFWPAAWSADNVQTAEGVMTCQATLDAEQDFGSATQGSPVWTLLKQVILRNNVSTTMAA